MTGLKELAQAAVKIADAERSDELAALQVHYYALRSLVVRLCPEMEGDLPRSVEGLPFAALVAQCSNARLMIEPALGYEFWAWRQRQRDAALWGAES